VSKENDDAPLKNILHKTIKKVSGDIERMEFNTAISSLMIFVNECEKRDSISRNAYETLLLLLTPFAPHITEELWSVLGNKSLIHTQSWPEVDETFLVSDRILIPIQINGKMRASMEISNTMTEDEVKNAALAFPQIVKWIGERGIKKVIYVKEKIINIVL